LANDGVSGDGSIPHRSRTVTEVSTALAATPRPGSIFAWWSSAGHFEKLARQAFAIAFWLYVTCQLFLFDLDRLISDRLPADVRWIVEYKFSILIGVATALLLVVSKRRVLAWALYVAFYPVTRLALGVLILSVAIIRLKSWSVLFTVLNLVLSFFASFRFNFIATAGALIACLIVVNASAPPTISIGIAILLALIVALIARRFIALFQPSRLFKLYTRIIAGALNFSRKILLADARAKGLDLSALNDQQRKRWENNFQMAVMLREACRFLEARFRQYRTSGLPVAFYLVNFFLLLLAVITLMGFVNAGLFRADPAAFVISGSHRYLDFFYYAFGALFFQHIPEIAPASTAAKALWMFEALLAGVFGGMLLSLFLAARKNLDEAAIQPAIDGLGKQQREMDAFVETEFAVHGDEAAIRADAMRGRLAVVIKGLRAERGDGNC